MPALKPIRGSLLNKSHLLARGLVGFWLFNEGSGNVVSDLSGNGNHATATGTISEITWQSGPDGGVVDFVGNSIAYFAFKQAISWAAADAWTIIVKCISDGDAGEEMLLGKYNDTNNYIWWRGGSYFRFYSNTGNAANFTSVTSFTSWATYAVVAKGDGNLYLSIDGLFKEKVAVATDFVIDNIGNGYNSLAYEWDGRVSYVLIYNRALSAFEIALIYREPFCMIRQRGRLSFWSAPAVAAAAARRSRVGFRPIEGADKLRGLRCNALY